MVDIKAALKKARSAGQAASPRGRAIVEVHSFDEKEGTATGKILDGLGAGEVITFKLTGKLGVEDYVKKSRTKVILAEGDKPGGTLQVEGLKKREGSDVYETRWVKTFRSKPDDEQEMHNRKTFTLRVRKQRDSDKTYANLDILDMENEAHVTKIEDLRPAMIDAVNKTGAVTLMSVLPGNDPVVLPLYAKSVKQEDGSYARETGEAWLAAYEDRLKGRSDLTLEDAFGEALDVAGVSVVPTTSMRVGNGTWEAVEEKVNEAGRGGPVDPETFKVSTVSGRLAGAYARLEIEADRDALTSAFLKTAPENAKVAFHEGGFGAVEPRDVSEFIASKGIKLIDASEPNGFILGSVLTRPYSTAKPESGHMVTKTFNVSAPAPFPPVKAFGKLREAYYAEMLDAAKSIAEMELSGGTKDVQAQTPAATTPAAETPATAAAEEKPASTPAAAIADSAALEDDDIDDLLGDLAENGIDP